MVVISQAVLEAVVVFIPSTCIKRCAARTNPQAASTGNRSFTKRYERFLRHVTTYKTGKASRNRAAITSAGVRYSRQTLVATKETPHRAAAIMSMSEINRYVPFLYTSQGTALSSSIRKSGPRRHGF